MLCRDVIQFLEQMAPNRYAESWDNVGLLVGHEEQPVKKIMVALDSNESVIDQSIEQNVDMLITHHPLIFSPLKRMDWNNPNARKVVKLIENNIACYAIHTNFDVKIMADMAAKKLSLSHIQILDITYVEKYYKLVVFVPKDSEQKVRQALTKEGAGFIGKYSDCTFAADGTGSFKPLDGTNPYIGKQDELTFTEEVRLESIVKAENLDRTILSMLRAHPYEEVAYDVYSLENEVKKEGIGRYGYLAEDMSLCQLAQVVKEGFGISNVKCWGDPEKKVASVAVSPGAGKSMIEKALKAKADVLITGDIDHHSALDALDAGLMIIDGGHYGTEYFMVDYVKQRLTNYLSCQNEDRMDSQLIEVVEANEKEPFYIV